MTVAVAAGNSCWRNYSSGILTNAMGCPTGIDHAVTVVAYTATTDGTAGETTTETTCEMMPAETVCRGATRQEKRNETCSDSYDVE